MVCIVHQDIDQGTPEWFSIRAGVPTASMFHAVMASGRGGSDSKTRRAYLLRLAGEKITGEPAETYSNHHMERGRVLEAEARDFYALMRDAQPEQVGFISNLSAGCSPDSLVGDAGLLEVKTKLPHLMIDLILKDEFPSEHKAQTQGQLWVSEREFVDLICYWPGLPPFIKRSFRDESYIRDLEAAVDQFNSELAEVVERIKSYGLREQEAA